jgi:methyl-accepting chemotaxis protein
MALGRRRGLLTKFYLAMLLAVLPLLLLLPSYVLPALREQLYADRVRAVRQLVQAGHGILEAHEARVRAGELSLEQAQAQAAALLGSLRYSGQGYYWLNDLNTRLVMHPFLPGRIGDDMRGYRDVARKPVFVDIVSLARERGEGVVEYLATRPGSMKPIPKVSYVKLFEPWGWVLGTGVYVEDIEREVEAMQRRLGGAVGVGVVLAVLAGVYFSRRVLGPIRSLMEGARRVARGDLRVEVVAPSHDEVGELGQAFNAMVAQVRGMVRGMAEVAEATAAGSAHIHRSADGLLCSAQGQGQGLRQMADAVEGMAERAAVGAHQAELVAKAAADNGRMAREGGVVVRGTGRKMEEIARVVERSTRTVARLQASGEEVEWAVEYLQDIADQTRVLAVNTAIEAVRTGEHGKGIAVVAAEVRDLADRARTAAERIGKLMQESRQETQEAAALMREGQQRVQEGLALSAETGQALERIVSGAEEIQRRVMELARAHARHSSEGEALTLRLQGLSEQTQEAAEGVVRISHAVKDLEARARQLRALVARFRVDAG